MKKYELMREYKIVWNSKELYQIRALKDFGDIRKGDFGGFIESERNLSHEGNCWITKDVKVCDHATIIEDAIITGTSIIKDCSIVSGKSRINSSEIREQAVISGDVKCDGGYIYGYAHVYEHAQIKDSVRVFGNSSVYGHAMIKDHASIHANAKLHGNCQIGEFADVAGHAIVMGHALITGEAKVLNYAVIGGEVKLSGKVQVKEEVQLLGNDDLSSDIQITNEIYRRKMDFTNLLNKSGTFVRLRNGEYFFVVDKQLINNHTIIPLSNYEGLYNSEDKDCDVCQIGQLPANVPFTIFYMPSQLSIHPEWIKWCEKGDKEWMK